MSYVPGEITVGAPLAVPTGVPSASVTVTDLSALKTTSSVG
jgi:hypothetical protein